MNRRPLFHLLDFPRELHSGDASDWMIDCRALGHRDLQCLAELAHRLVGPWGEVEGVPQGGLRFARACWELSFPGASLLVVNDVCTTGTSLEDFRAGREAKGVVIFALGPCPDWVTPLFSFADLTRGAPAG